MNPGDGEELSSAVARLKRNMIAQALAESGGNHTEATASSCIRRWKNIGWAKAEVPDDALTPAHYPFAITR
jgi:hypothetical protein